MDVPELARQVNAALAAALKTAYGLDTPEAVLTRLEEIRDALLVADQGPLTDD